MELAVLSCLLQDPKLHGKVDLDQSDFPEYSDVFKNMQRIISEGKNPDMILMGEFLSNDFLSTIAEYEPSTIFFMDYVKDVKEKSAKRKIEKACLKIQENPTPKNAQSILDEVLKETRIVSGAMGADDLINFYREQLKDESQNIPIESGFKTFDKMSGLYKGELTTLAALTSIGKSAIGMNIALSAAMSGKKVLFISSEMTTRRLLDRVYSYFTGTDNTIFKKGTPSDTKLELAEKGMKSLGSNFKLKQINQCTSEDINSLAIREEVKDGLDLIVVDHIHSLHDEMKKGETTASKYNRMMANFQDVSVSLNCSFLLLAQFNRDGYKGKRPTISDLKESSSIEQFSTNVVVLHREDRDSSEAELYIDKARNGEVGMINLRFEKSTTTFTEPSTIEKMSW